MHWVIRQWVTKNQWSRREYAWEKPTTANGKQETILNHSLHMTCLYSQPLHFLTLSLQLTSVLPVTCYGAVLWPELWLQWRSDHCLRGYSAWGKIRHEHTWVRSTLNKLHVSVAMAMFTTTGANDTRMGLNWHFKNSNWSIGSVVTIATDYKCTINTEGLCFCCYWQFLTTNGAGMASNMGTWMQKVL